MTMLPLFMMLALYKMEPVAMAPLFNTLMGWGVLAVIAVMAWPPSMVTVLMSA